MDATTTYFLMLQFRLSTCVLCWIACSINLCFLNNCSRINGWLLVSPPCAASSKPWETHMRSRSHQRGHTTVLLWITSHSYCCKSWPPPRTDLPTLVSLELLQIILIMYVSQMAWQCLKALTSALELVCLPLFPMLLFQTQVVGHFVQAVALVSSDYCVMVVMVSRYDRRTCVWTWRCLVLIRTHLEPNEWTFEVSATLPTSHARN